MNESFLAIILWHNPMKRFGCLQDLSGCTYIFMDASLAKDFVPTPSVIVGFRIEYGKQNATSRNDYTVILVEPADLESADDADMEALTKAYAEFADKEERKRQRREEIYKQRRDETFMRGRPEAYNIRPLKDRFAD